MSYHYPILVHFNVLYRRNLYDVLNLLADSFNFFLLTLFSYLFGSSLNPPHSGLLPTTPWSLPLSKSTVLSTLTNSRVTSLSSFLTSEQHVADKHCPLDMSPLGFHTLWLCSYHTSSFPFVHWEGPPSLGPFTACTSDFPEMISYVL